MKKFPGILCFLFVLGCKREQAVAPPPPTTHPAAQVAEPSTLEVEGLIVHFPPLRLRAQATGGGLAVDLTTPTADPAGDRVDLSLTLDDVDDPADLDGAAWHFHTDDPERGDTLNRITLREPYSVLEPADVQIVFTQEAERTTVRIDGQFRWYDPPDAEKPARVVTVSGKLFAPFTPSPARAP